MLRLCQSGTSRSHTLHQSTLHAWQDAWVRQFYEQVQLPASRGGGAGQRPNILSQRLWSREVTDELWL